MEKNKKKEIFFVAVTDEFDSKNRKYSDSVRTLCQAAINENRHDGISYVVNRHDMIKNGSNLKYSLFEKIADSNAFIVLLDQYENGFNPNVWFELGVISTIPDIKLICIAKYNTPIPFDIGSEVKVVHISKEVLELFETNFKSSTTFNAANAFNDSEPEVAKFKKDIKIAFDNSDNPFTKWYEYSQLKKSYGFDSLTNFLKALRIDELLNEDNARVRYIDGEENAFEELTKAIKAAHHSLRTSRFANQSIVKGQNDNKAGTAHKNFMEALKEASYRIDGLFERIICINSCEKWYDVHTALSEFCPEKSIVYLRKSEFSIKFELVIIDEEVSFIHFYLADDPENMKNQPERIRSTLKITGSKISKKLADIFDRLHHRDYNAETRIDLSRTLLGVEEDSNGELLAQNEERGFLKLHKSNEWYASMPSETIALRTKTDDAMREIKKVLNWKLNDSERNNLEAFLEEVDFDR